MIVASAVLVIVGGLMTLAGTAWLRFGIKPNDPRYNTAAQRNEGLRNLLNDQQAILSLLAAGATIQLFGAVLALAAAIRAQ